MKKKRKNNPGDTIKRPLKTDDKEKRQPNPEDPYEENGMPNKEMPDSNNFHNEEFLNHIPK